MSQYLEEFIEFFNLSSFYDGTVLTVQDTIGLSITAFIGAVFTILGFRCVLELIKIVTDWSRFK